MSSRRSDVASRLGITADRLKDYERAGLIGPMHTDGQMNGRDELLIEIIAKAELLGFSLEEIKLILQLYR